MGGGEGQEETCRGDGEVHYLDSDEAFTGVCICQNVSNCTLQIGTIHDVSYTSIQLLEKPLYCERISASNIKVNETNPVFWKPGV